MDIQIYSTDDSLFRIVSTTMGEKTILPEVDGSPITQEEKTTEQPKTEEVEILPEVEVAPVSNNPHNVVPAPLENPRSNRMGWFDNTSWDDGKRGHRFD